MKYILYILIVLCAKVSLGQSDSIISPKLKDASILETDLLNNYYNIWKNYKDISGQRIEREGKVLERVKVTLFINEIGNPSDVTLVKSSNNENYDKYIVNKFKKTDQWYPAILNNAPLISQILVTVDEGKIRYIQLLLPNKKEVFKPVDKMPEYIGGMGEMMGFIIKTKIYPKEVKQQNIVGKAIVTVVVDSVGNIVKPEIAQTSGNSLLDLEAIRVVSLMPKWKPGNQNGKNVPVKISLPISFDIDNQLTKFLKERNELANKYYNDGVNYFGANKFLMAKTSFLNALTLNNYDTDSKYNLATTYLKLNQKDSACYYWDLLSHSLNEKDKLEAEILIKKHCSN